jgi:EpsI family protein
MKADFKEKNFVLVVGLLVLSMAVSWRLFFQEYNQQDTANIHQFPKTLAGWTAEELPISNDDYADLETRNAFIRKYKGPAGENIYLFIVYSQNNRKVSHPPEICYTGSGATIVSNVSAAVQINPFLPAIRANRLLVEQKGTQQILYYWFKVGNTFTSNYLEQQILIAWKTFLGQPASSALIRISADVQDEDAQKACKEVEQFIRLIRSDLIKYLP